jgi:hypothetical protein
MDPATATIPLSLVAWFVDIFAKLFFSVGYLLQKMGLLQSERRLEEEEI